MKYITINEYMRIVPVCYRTAIRHCQDGKIPARKIGGKWFIKQSTETNHCDCEHENDHECRECAKRISADWCKEHDGLCAFCEFTLHL